MQNRSQSIDAFLVRSGWGGAVRAPLAGDASFRRYERIFLREKHAVLMDAPPEKEDMQPFIHVGEHLQAQGFSAPEIYARDLGDGFLLLEDLGDDLFTKLLLKTPHEEEALYTAATDVLIELYKQAEKADYSAFPLYDESRLLNETTLFSEWFLPAVMGSAHATELAPQYTSIWQELIHGLPKLRPVLVLRDYHADNLLWLPTRKALARVGLLDFQDGVIGSPAYDMVSFLEDARRDVQDKTVEKVLAHYLEATQISPEDFATAYALLGAQRNCKIIGIFTRLAVRDGKQHYISYLPRVWRHLEKDMQHKKLKPLKEWIDNHVKREWRGVFDVPAKTKTAV